VVGAGGTERHLPRDSSIETIGDTSVQSNMAAIARISADQCGLPLMLFTQVGHCYLLTYLLTFLSHSLTHLLHGAGHYLKS
jgi:hypothetical protein